MGAAADRWWGAAGKRLSPEQRWTLFAFWEQLGVRPCEVGDLELWEFQLAVECFNERAEEQARVESGRPAAGRSMSVEQARAQGLIPDG